MIAVIEAAEIVDHSMVPIALLPEILGNELEPGLEEALPLGSS
ncbi:hypothetical protein SLEP1_g43826 [Rubroshorea leprosula]|uniref:Uncharacterized protein n=1 Tax=Rubroshorea leprosula TaxID=152421 RepID=A0AAV5LEA6_9ROSI|nr:hypothetical protein SLEP1_g43826 [Rubroshorea leprosula]